MTALLVLLLLIQPACLTAAKTLTANYIVECANVGCNLDAEAHELVLCRKGLSKLRMQNKRLQSKVRELKTSLAKERRRQVQLQSIISHLEARLPRSDRNGAFLGKKLRRSRGCRHVG